MIHVSFIHRQMHIAPNLPTSHLGSHVTHSSLTHATQHYSHCFLLYACGFSFCFLCPAWYPAGVSCLSPSSGVWQALLEYIIVLPCYWWSRVPCPSHMHLIYRLLPFLTSRCLRMWSGVVFLLFFFFCALCQRGRKLEGSTTFSTPWRGDCCS